LRTVYPIDIVKAFGSPTKHGAVAHRVIGERKHMAHRANTTREQQQPSQADQQRNAAETRVLGDFGGGNFRQGPSGNKEQGQKDQPKDQIDHRICSSKRRPSRLCALSSAARPPEA
jgi:hypothetical protein